MTIDLEPKQLIDSPPPSLTLAILGTCRQIACEVQEALPAHFYAENIFAFSTRKPHCIQRSTTMRDVMRNSKVLYSDKVNHWLHCIGHANFNFIRAVKFELYNLEILLERDAAKPQHGDGPEIWIPDAPTLGDFVRLFRTNSLESLKSSTATISDGRTSVCLPPYGSTKSTLHVVANAFANAPRYGSRHSFRYDLDDFRVCIWDRT